ncbi:MAG: LysR family transcriptional regulator [Clostridia bacterium]|nr:LysR family transcriptional regulator [Clostridia bacterium]
MEIQKLKYFYAVAKHQHVTKAAEEMHISQPSLTQAMHLLERELEVPLFQKQGRRIVLTEFGRYLKAKLDILLPEFDNLPKEMQQMASKSNKTVKLNILAMSTFVINAIVNYRKKNEDVIFDFEQSELKHDCDIVITTNGSKEAHGSNYVKRCVKEERIYLAVPRNSVYAKRKEIDLIEVKDENFIMLSSSRLFGVICNKFCSMAGFLPKILFESDSPVAVQNIISMGSGVAFWPEYSWGKVKNKNIVLLPIVNPVCQRDLIIDLHERMPKSEYAQEFYEYLLKQLKCSV